MEIHNLSSVQDLRLQHQIYPQQKGKTGFATLYQKEMEKTGLQFSKHAAARMNERGVELNSKMAEDLKAAVEQARGKGAKDVVVIGSDSAFIVNVTNNTVVTTMNAREMKNNIFTNIDSAVLI